MKCFFTSTLFCMCILLVTGCSPHHTVILLPDLDGHLGKAEVITTGGKQHLDKAQGMTTVSGPSFAPSPTSVASMEFIAATFAEVMAIEPPPAEKFILYFRNNTTELIPESRAKIDSILKSVQRRGAIRISISGHTDATGSSKLNDDLARDRSQVISGLLTQLNIDAKLLNVSSHGKGNQLVPTADGVSEPRNRRVEVIVR